MNMKIAASFWCLDLLDVKNIPAIALQELTEGDDTRSLRFLAGATHDSSLEIEQLFKRTLVELSITIPDKFEAGNQVAAYYAHAIISGEITPYTGARKIWFDVYNNIGYPQELETFVGYASEYEDFEHWAKEGDSYYQALLKKIDGQIIDEAKILLEHIRVL